ncbi:MAG TPA: MJ0042-type zinc finger domain-containing protein [Devosia sp.]|nr:MJ0042-type zinc finger domain-containing protein [Devosia sp.]
MSSADLATVVITCPHCGTRYQVPHATLGADGREVQCAQCGKSWHAEATLPPPPAVEPDALFPAEEAGLDRAFEAEAAAAAPEEPARARHDDPEYERTLAEIRAAIAPKPKKAAVNNIDPKLLRKVQQSFSRRQRALFGGLPLARVRRTARLGAFVLLISMLVLGFSLREDLVRWFPSLAGLYAAVGLPVNVVGLEFQDSKTITTLRDGKMVMQVSARIRSIAPRAVKVPPVLVSLVNDKGAAIYEWTVSPSVSEMEPGEVLDITTEVNSPPPAAVAVRLSFTTKAS